MIDYEGTKGGDRAGEAYEDDSDEDTAGGQGHSHMGCSQQ